ncbi:MAG: DNA replication and repair protein RecF [Gammaproteobacteria bacterium]|nr:DNA replication and repair protein RecF [Gammaproteobacteria bacterium]
MRLEKIQAYNYRKLAQVEVEFSPRLTLIEGDNAAGKTTLLEAIKTLSGSTREARASAERLGDGDVRWRLSGWIRQIGPTPTRCLRVSGDRFEMERTLDQRIATAAETAKTLPLLSVDQGADALVAAGPAHRRRYLDWLLFHVEPGFLDCWRRYRRALAQRNSALAAGGRHGQAMIEALEHELAVSGEMIARLRRQHFEAAYEELLATLKVLVGGGEWRVELSDGWNTDEPLAEALRRQREVDKKIGRTQLGPHRGDLKFARDGHDARRRLSGGEEKLTATALRLHQARRLLILRGVSPLLLIDDFSAELAAAAQSRLAAALSDYDGQVVITELAGGSSALPALSPRRFHVEHGRLQRMVE